MSPGTIGTATTTTLSGLVTETSRRGRRALWFIGSLALVGTVAEALAPWLIGRSLLLATDPNAGSLVTTIAVLGLLILLSIACSVIRFVMSSRFRISTVATLRRQVGQHVSDEPMATGEAVTAAHVATVVASDLDNIAGYPLAVLRLMTSLVGFIVVSAYLLESSVTLGLLVLAGVPALMLLTAKVAEPLESRQERHRDLVGTVSDLCGDIGLGLRVLRGIGAQRVFFARFRAVSRQAQRAGVDVARTQALLQTTGLVLPGLLLVAVVWLGGHLAISGTIAPAELVTFYVASAYLVSPIETFTGFSSSRSQAKVGATNLARILDARGPAWVGDMTPVPQDADLVDLTDGCVVNPRAMTVIMPEDTDDGQALGSRLGGMELTAMVTLADASLAAYERSALRGTVRFHGHRPVLFSGPVREVLDPTNRYSDVEIESALHTAAADEIVHRLPSGLSERLGAQGRTLSGGQRQRLALARSLLGDPAYLILVNPSSSLDAVSEIEVARRISTRRRHLTTVVVSSSPAYQAVADHVVRGVPR